MSKRIILLFTLVISVALGLAQMKSATHAGISFDVKSINNLEIVNGKTSLVDYAGKPALRLLPDAAHETTDEAVLAIIPGTDFKDGTIEADIVGLPREGMPESARGFVGIAFRVQPHGSSYEAFYIRPTNSRSDDPVRRNHTTQYVSEPEFPWFKLREQFPGKYESHADLDAKAWTHIKIEVASTTAKLYVNNAPKPDLVVTDLKHGETRGQIALWGYTETDAYFSTVTVK